VKERKDRVDDALNATRAAVEEGIVPAAASPCCAPPRRRSTASRATTTTRRPASTSSAALQAPIRQIAENAGVEGSSSSARCSRTNGTFGFNAQTEEYGDLVKAGIIDPAKVVRTALQDAASVAGLLITTEAMIAEQAEEGSRPGGGMPAAAWAAWAAWTSSMDPPSMLICVNRTASSHAILEGGANFALNILHTGQMDVARTCGGAAKGEERFGSGNWQADAQGVPYLADAQAAIICHQRQRISYGSHDIFIGDVQAVRLADSADPLVYFDGAYRRIGDKL
jgi:flavin reductase (DIM6/NTAB) family NADH-FMN oxidoreductase RutF